MNKRQQNVINFIKNLKLLFQLSLHFRYQYQFCVVQIRIKDADPDPGGLP